MSERTAVDVLRAARKFIEPPDAWTQGPMRRTVGGRVVARCLYAAICDAAGPIHVAARIGAEDLIRKAIGGGSIIGWNEVRGRTHAEVLDAIDRAIVAGEKAAGRSSS
jgi:hypothetical protein